jgi:hypothetical protein
LDIITYKRGSLMNNTRNLFVGFGSIVLLLVLSGLSMAATTSPQSVTFQVQAVNEITVSGNPAALIVNTATAGSNPDSVTDSSTTYNITTNEAAKKITGQITTGGNMPANVTLEVSLVAPTGGSSSGYVTLTSAAASDLVTAVNSLAESGKTITYRLSATVGAGAVPSDTRVVTLTLSD